MNLAQPERHPLMVWLSLAVLIGTLSATVVCAESYVWEDYRVPFKQTFRFSTAETALVRVTLPADVLSASDRLQMHCQIDKTSPWVRPYLMVNNNRNARYYLGGNGRVSIRTDHLKAGENELVFRDQTTTGDLIFVYALQFQIP